MCSSDLTKTIVCADCKALYDVPVKLRVAEGVPPPPRRTKKSASLLPEQSDPTKILIFGEPPRTKWVSLKPGCPVAAHHRVEVWTAPGKCPRCGNYVERTVLPFRIWD